MVMPVVNKKYVGGRSLPYCSKLIHAMLVFCEWTEFAESAIVLKVVHLYCVVLPIVVYLQRTVLYFRPF